MIGLRNEGSNWTMKSGGNAIADPRCGYCERWDRIVGTGVSVW